MSGRCLLDDVERLLAGAGAEDLDVAPLEREPEAHRLDDVGRVVHHEDPHQSTSGGPSAGTTMLNMLPSPGALVDVDAARRAPGRSRARSAAPARPRARRRSGRCWPTKKRSKRCGCSSSGMPGPSSRDRPGDGPCDRRTRTAIVPPAGPYLTALEMRLTRACSRRRWSPKTRIGARRHVELDRLVALGRQGRDRGDRPAGQRRRVEAAQLEDDLARPEAGDLEDVADDALHAVGVALDRPQQRVDLAGGGGGLPGRAARRRRCGSRSAACAARGRSWRGGRSAVVRARRGARRPPRRHPGCRPASGGQGS